MSRFGRQVSLFVAAVAISFPAFGLESGVSSYTVEIGPSLVSGGETARGRIAVVRDPRIPAETLTFKLGSSNSNLIRFPVEVITIPANKTVGTFDLGTGATPIRTTVSVQAYLGPSLRTSVSAPIELVPALLKSVTLSSPSMIGTNARTINVTAELKAPAPTGGIELYLSPFKLATSQTGIKAANVPPVTHRVQAGSRSVTFPTRYNDVIASFENTTQNPLETQTRRFEQIVALDPQSSNWSPIPSRAIAYTFDIVPLVVTSVTVQPASISGTGEAIATLVLNATPGPNERATLARTGSGSNVVLQGSSCAAANSGLPIELLFASGVTYHFKVCGRGVASPTTDQVGVRLRSGLFTTNVTVQP